VTAPGGSIGRAYVDVHANTEPFNREVDRDLGDFADKAEGKLKKSGEEMGDQVSKSLATRIGSKGKDYAKAIGDATRNTVIQIRSAFDFKNTRQNLRRGFRRDVGDVISEEIGDALDRTARSGVFSKISQGVADAVGAGFNVSGRSPLIAVLLPALLALVGVIVAAVQAVGALVAILITLPALIGSIALQVGVVAIAFNGVGEAMKNAFAAKNVKELDAALKGLTPSARTFVKTLLPLRELFRQIQKAVQENFFDAMGNIIEPLRKALGGPFLKGFSQLATDMGHFFRDLALFFASPTFVKFVNDVFPATGRWMAKFGPALVDFLTGLFAMADAALPFLEGLGGLVSGFLVQLGLEWQRFARSPEFQIWLEDMLATTQELFSLLGGAFRFLMVFMAQLNTAGGADIIRELVTALDRMAFFFGSPVGLQAMQGLVTLSIVGIQTFTGLVIAIGLVLAAFQSLVEWLGVTGFPFILDVFRTIGQTAVDFSNFFAAWASRIVGWIWGFLTGIGRAIGNFFIRMWQDIKRFFDTITKSTGGAVNALRALPGKLLAAVANFGSLLYNSGQNLILGLTRGIRAQIQPFLNLINWIVGQIGRVFPGSPAKEGPLSGRGYVLFRGQRMMQDFIRGMEMEAPNLRQASMNATSNIVFGPNSIQMSITGPVPDQAQARTFGSALGESAANAIAARNTRLAVRTL
jgi:hypothetical protein